MNYQNKSATGKVALGIIKCFKTLLALWGFQQFKELV